MRAVRVHQVGGPEVLTIEKVPIPEPSSTQVCVRIMAIGINPVETYIRSAKSGRTAPSFPYTPGQDCAGIVEKVGADVKQFNFGDRVFSTNCVTGSYAQFALCEVSSIQPLPESVSFDEGAALHVPYHTAYHALFHIAKVRDGETVFIHGCSGATGMACLQFAKSRGLTVIGSAGTSEGIELIEQQGADFTVNHREDGYMNRVLEFTKGRGVDVVVEMLANVNLGNDLPCLAKGGRVAVIGSRGPVQIDARELMTRRASILGVFMGNATTDEVSEINDALQAGLLAGYLKPIVYLVFPFDQVSESHVQVINPSAGARGKIVVHPWD